MKAEDRGRLARGVKEKKFYDPEYDRIVDESVIKKQYDWFKSQSYFCKTYEQFLADNFLNEDMTEIVGTEVQI